MFQSKYLPVHVAMEPRRSFSFKGIWSLRTPVRFHGNAFCFAKNFWSKPKWSNPRIVRMVKLFVAPNWSTPKDDEVTGPPLPPRLTPPPRVFSVWEPAPLGARWDHWRPSALSISPWAWGPGAKKQSDSAASSKPGSIGFSLTKIRSFGTEPLSPPPPLKTGECSPQNSTGVRIYFPFCRVLKHHLVSPFSGAFPSVGGCFKEEMYRESPRIWRPRMDMIHHASPLRLYHLQVQ